MYIIPVYNYYEFILQVSLVVKIEVEACSYRELFISVPCNSTLDLNKTLLVY